MLLYSLILASVQCITESPHFGYEYTLVQHLHCSFHQALLHHYGPNVPESTLKKLVSAFSELRQMADEGLIAYPYSTREVVNIVKHIQVCLPFHFLKNELQLQTSYKQC